MVEEIKLLLPLLQKVSDGGIYLLLTMLLVDLLKVVAIVTGACAIIYHVARIVYQFYEENSENANRWAVIRARLQMFGIQHPEEINDEDQWKKLADAWETYNAYDITKKREEELTRIVEQRLAALERIRIYTDPKKAA